MSANDHLAAILRELSGVREPDKVPTGWYTSAQLANADGRSQSRMVEVIRKALADGRLEMRSFRVATGSRVVPVPHYRAK